MKVENEHYDSALKFIDMFLLFFFQVIKSKRGTSSATGKPSIEMETESTEQLLLGTGRQLA